LQNFKENKMSLDSAHQGQLEDKYEEILDVLYLNILNDDKFDDMLSNHIDNAMAEAGRADEWGVMQADLWDDAVKALQSKFSSELSEIRRENGMLKDNIKSLQGQLQEAYKKIT
tara:strand:+ start:2893 stop:3234 length:342 start_codon:yes stop_codon:yes gene_type:complete